MAKIDHLIGVNLRGTMLTTRSALPLMRRTGGGTIINVSCTIAKRPRAGGAAYAATKGGIDAFTRP